MYCVAVYLPHGVDLRLMEDDGALWQTQLVRDPLEARSQELQWREKLSANGWALEAIRR